MQNRFGKVTLKEDSSSPGKVQLLFEDIIGGGQRNKTMVMWAPSTVFFRDFRAANERVTRVLLTSVMTSLSLSNIATVALPVTVDSQMIE